MNPGSDTFRVNLRRDGPSQSWGFRLQGGTDFTTALSVQAVNPGSIAERAGLQAGDAVLQINNRPSDELEHEQAKQEIVASGNEVFMVVQRGVVKIWKPKVTPMSELRPKEMKLAPDGSAADDVYVQKTSLAADKADIQHIGTGYNRTARPFGASFGGGASGGGAGATVPAVVNAQYNSPIGIYSTENAVNTYQAQAAVLTGNMQGLTVAETEPKVGPSPTLLAVQGNGTEFQPKRTASPSFLATEMARSRSPAFRSASPSFHGSAAPDDGTDVNKTSMFNEVLRELGTSGGPDSKSAVYKDLKEGEELEYQGYINPRKQSRTFYLLEKGLAKCDSEPEEGSAGGSADPRPPGIRSVKAPVFDPSQHEVQQAQHMTCKICGSLIIGVFVRIKDQPLHPECFKCCRCGKNLKNQGYFHVEGQMYCEVHAKEASRPESGPGTYAVPIYR